MKSLSYVNDDDVCKRCAVEIVRSNQEFTKRFLMNLLSRLMNTQQKGRSSLSIRFSQHKRLCCKNEKSNYL